MGEGAVNAIVEERKENGHFNSIFDLTKRINLRSANKKCLEGMAMAGAFDCFKGTFRAQYFHQESPDDTTFLDKAIRLGSNYQSDKHTDQISMFSIDPIEIKDPEMPSCEPWSKIELLAKEREVTGMYLSGHPLDNYKFELRNFCNLTVADLSADITKYKNREITIGGIVTDAKHRTTKNGNPFGTLVIEDYTDSMQFALFSESYLKMRHFLKPGEFLFIKGSVQLRWKSENQYEFRISEIQLLSEVRYKLAKSITMQVALGDLSDKFVDDITHIINSNTGQCRLNFVVGEKSNGCLVEMHSKSFKVDLNNEFIDALEGMPEVNYKLN